MSFLTYDKLKQYGKMSENESKIFYALIDVGKELNKIGLVDEAYKINDMINDLF